MTAPGISVAYHITCTPPMCNTSVAYQILVRHRCVAHLTAYFWKSICGVPRLLYATDVNDISGVHRVWYATDDFPHLAADLLHLIGGVPEYMYATDVNDISGV